MKLNQEMKISIIGAGNLAVNLALALEKSGFNVGEIFSRNIKNAEFLANQLYHTIPQNHLDFSDSTSSLFFLAVSDDALPEVVNNIALPAKATLVHTSGTIELVLLNRFENHGVFYPIQTFSKNHLIDFNQIPIAIEASNADTSSLLTSIANKVSGNFTFLDSEERRVVHLAAVFACNFTNHLLGVAYDVLDKKNLDITILKPLILETIRKAMSSEHPFTSQTGPAIRNDMLTIEKHLKMLSEEKENSRIYQLMTQQIQQQQQ
ncbi:MAG: DUF2520 domain-containing protein [Cytophagales bacterium]|nr:MAG: DUF2520 domain-containing protein [Cytophagales bacterium]